MMVAFLLGGILVLYVSLRELARRIANYHRFEHAEGVIVSIRSKTLVYPKGPRMRRTVMHFPVIKFSDQKGETITFKSETGDTGPASRYASGQRIDVIYDPAGELKPMINSWSGVWLPNLMGVLGGVVFLFGALLIYWAFWDRIVGP